MRLGTCICCGQDPRTPLTKHISAIAWWPGYNPFLSASVVNPNQFPSLSPIHGNLPDYYSPTKYLTRRVEATRNMRGDQYLQSFYWDFVDGEYVRVFYGPIYHTWRTSVWSFTSTLRFDATYGDLVHAEYFVDDQEYMETDGVPSIDYHTTESMTWDKLDAGKRYNDSNNYWYNGVTRFWPTSIDRIENLAGYGPFLIPNPDGYHYSQLTASVSDTSAVGTQTMNGTGSIDAGMSGSYWTVTDSTAYYLEDPISHYTVAETAQTMVDTYTSSLLTPSSSFINCSIASNWNWISASNKITKMHWGFSDEAVKTQASGAYSGSNFIVLMPNRSHGGWKPVAGIRGFQVIGADGRMLGYGVPPNETNPNPYGSNLFLSYIECNPASYGLSWYDMPVLTHGIMSHNSAYKIFNPIACGFSPYDHITNWTLTGSNGTRLIDSCARGYTVPSGSFIFDRIFLNTYNTSGSYKDMHINPTYLTCSCCP